jgi:hypothetical protein
VVIPIMAARPTTTAPIPQMRGDAMGLRHGKRSRPHKIATAPGPKVRSYAIAIQIQSKTYTDIPVPHGITAARSHGAESLSGQSYDGNEPLRFLTRSLPACGPVAHQVRRRSTSGRSPSRGPSR